MHCNISLETFVTLGENGFSLDELVIKTKELFENEGLSGFLAIILQFIDENLFLNLGYKGKWQPEPCCDRPTYEMKDKIPRRFRTSVGTVRIYWHRVRCCNCGRISIPLRSFMSLKKYQSKTSELEKIVSEVVSEQSYRRGTEHLNTIGSIPVPKSTSHRWIMASDCDEMPTNEESLQLILPDGTGYKRRPDPKNNKNNRGNLRVVLGIDYQGNAVPLGAFSGQSWDDIAQQIHPQEDESSTKIADILLSDGGKGISEAFADMVNMTQRCQWHTIRDLNYIMWHDKASKNERDIAQRELAATLGIDLPAEDFQHVSSQDKSELEDKTVQAEKELDELIERFRSKGYYQAAKYVRNSKDHLFTYVRFWLKTGLLSPKASSMIERMMREIGRRLKRIAFGWSEKGAAKMARIIIKRFTHKHDWEKFWNKRLNITGNVMLVFRGAKII